MSKVLVDREDFAHELWSAAQLAPGEGISDGVARIAALLAQPAEADGPSFAEVLEQASVIQQLGAKNKRIDELIAALSAVTAERDRLATENEWLACDAKNDAIAYKAVIERQEELRAELDAIRAQRGEPVAEIVKCEPYEDGSTNPHNTVNWFGLNAENDLPAGTKLYATP